MSKPVNIDYEQIFQGVLAEHRKFVEDPSISPQQFQALADAHMENQLSKKPCPEDCRFCEIDRTAMANVILQLQGVRVKP